MKFRSRHIVIILGIVGIVGLCLTGVIAHLGEDEHVLSTAHEADLTPPILQPGEQVAEPEIQRGSAQDLEVSPVQRMVLEGKTVNATDVAPSKHDGMDAPVPVLDGHPVTSVIVTQCNLIVAAYLTMPDGKLLRVDHNSAMKADQLMQLAYTADRSERVEVGCTAEDEAQYERRDPI